jgi:endogenous inhibitor of DNA gyrase (YacG/DUF329 family)
VNLQSGGSLAADRLAIVDVDQTSRNQGSNLVFPYCDNQCHKVFLGPIELPFLILAKAQQYPNPPESGCKVIALVRWLYSGTRVDVSRSHGTSVDATTRERRPRTLLNGTQ